MNIKLKSGAVIEGSCSTVSLNVIEVTFNSEDYPSFDDLKGFELLRDNGELLFSSKGYDTLYKTIGNGYLLSNDGSVYVEPSDPGELPEYEPTLDELKASKKQEVGVACNSIIQAGVDVTFSDAHTEHFSLVENDLQHDQLNLFGKQVQLASGATQLEYHQDGQPCKYYTAEEMQLIVTAAMSFVSYHTTYCNSMNMWIKSVETKEELEKIYYGVDIPEEYQSEVLKTYLEQMKGDSAGTDETTDTDNSQVENPDVSETETQETPEGEISDKTETDLTEDSGDEKSE